MPLTLLRLRSAKRSGWAGARERNLCGIGLSIGESMGMNDL